MRALEGLCRFRLSSIFLALSGVPSNWAIAILACPDKTHGIIAPKSRPSKLSGARFLASIYTSIFRGTPLFLQLSLIYYAGLAVTEYNIAVWQAGVLSFSLNSAAYVPEIMRAGVQSIDRGQFEAAFALGIPRFLPFKDTFPPSCTAYFTGSSERNGRFT